MTQEFYAHSKEGKPPSEWQPLEEHLKNVAERANNITKPIFSNVDAFVKSQEFAFSVIPAKAGIQSSPE